MIAAAFATNAVAAASIEKLQIGISVKKEGLCPRQATIKVWVRSNGPGNVGFILEGQNGTKTGLLSVPTIKGAAGVWLATYSRNITIQTNVATRYRARGGNVVSPWAPLLANCGPQVRDKTSTSASDGQPRMKKSSEIEKPQPKKPTTTTSGGKPPVKKAEPKAPKTKNAGNSADQPKTSKKVTPQCRPETISSTRFGALTRATGKSTAWIGWSKAVQKRFGSGWSNSLLAKNRKESCEWKGSFNCRVSARPCRY